MKAKKGVAILKVALVAFGQRLETRMEFPPRGKFFEIKEGAQFMPFFDAAGLIPCITRDWQTHEVLMLSWMNREALARTLETELAHYYSRAAEALAQRRWKKGEQSRQAQIVKRILIDDDQDCLCSSKWN